MLNHVKLQGDVVAGPTIFPSAKNASIVARVTLAVPTPNREGARHHVEIVAFGHEAELLNMRATLDTKLEIIGHLESQGRYGLQTIADYVNVLDGALVVVAK